MLVVANAFDPNTTGMRQADFYIWGQPDRHWSFYTSQGYNSETLSKKSKSLNTPHSWYLSHFKWDLLIYKQGSHCATQSGLRVPESVRCGTHL